MAIIANTTLNSRTDMIAAIRAMQQYTGQPVCSAIDDQAIGQQIVKLQKYFAAAPDGTQASGFMFDPSDVKSNIADHSLPGATMQLQRMLVAQAGIKVASAFGPMKQKLESSQNVNILIIGDSTSYNAQGPYQIWHQQLAQKYSGTAALRLWGEWNNATGLPTGPKDYNAVVNTVYGAGPTITLWLLALPGSVSSFPWDSTRKATAIDPLPTPDLIGMHQGHNMQSFDVQAGIVTSGDKVPVGRGLLLGTVGMLSLQWPNVPQFMTTQNPNSGDALMNNMYASYYGAVAALPSLSLLDTATDFYALGRTANLYRPIIQDPSGIHPSDAVGNAVFDGATLQVNRLMAAYNLTPAGAFSTVSWPAIAGSNILTNGDFTNWPGGLPVNTSIFNSQTAAKDAGVVYSGGYAYSMRLDAVNRFGSLRYTFTAGEKAAMVNQIVSLAVLFKTTSTYSGGNVPFQAVLIVDNPAQASPGPIQWTQGQAPMAVSGNWYLAVIPGVQIGPSLGGSASINLYPNFPQTPTGGSTWVQKMNLVVGALPNGPF